VVCTLRDPDSLALPLVFISDTLRELGASQVGLVAPYLAYMRQDCRFHEGEAVTSTSFAKLISAKFDWLLTVDPHLHRYHSLAELYSIPAQVVHAAPLLAQWTRAHVTNPVIVGPDEESEQWAREVAEAVPCPYFVLRKARLGDRNVIVSPVADLNRWAGRTPVLVDDIVSSAVTMSETVRQWTVAGLEAPVCLGVHAVFAPGAVEMLRAAGARHVVTTNTISHDTNRIDVAPTLVSALRRLMA
jgi:ribose-phosphate pyrophosphokinase